MWKLSKNFYTVTALAVYMFTGTGNWNVESNWSNNAMPPSPLPPYSMISINPAGTGECILNVPVIVSHGDKLIVEPGKKLRVLSNLTIER